MVSIKSVAELRLMNLPALKDYKAKVFKAKLNAATPLEQEQFANQLERVNCILNESEASYYCEVQEKAFTDLQQDIDSLLLFASNNLKENCGAGNGVSFASSASNPKQCLEECP